MNKLHRNFKEIKYGFLTAKASHKHQAYVLGAYALILFIYFILLIISTIMFLSFPYISLCMFFISIALLILFTTWDEAFFFIMKVSSKIIDFFFARYGLVVRKKDWKRIKKESKDVYNFLWSKESIGFCYMTSWILALWLNDAKLIYLAGASEDGGKTAHVVVEKDDCIFDTNFRRHFALDEYIKASDAEIYKVFDRSDYGNEDFLKNITSDFKKWCDEHQVYCDLK